MRLYPSTLTMPGAAHPAENPLPRFRDVCHDKAVDSDGTLLPSELEGLGRHAGYRVLPYCVQDSYALELTEQTYETVVLENDHLRAEFIPSLGGRLWSLYDKDRSRELLFKNPVFRPANLAIRNAWFSGGIEWNMAQSGHTYSTCDKIFCARVTSPEGEEFLRMYDYVRTTGLLWQVDFHLPDDARCLYAHVRLLNDQSFPIPLYWWTNIALPDEKRLRVFSGTAEVIYINPNTLRKENAAHSYGHARLPELPSMPGVDSTYPRNSGYTNEFFFQNGPDARCPWEAAAYDDGFVFLERSTQPLATRKMFCWGNHRGGRNWTNRLSLPGQGAYVEIQAGLAPTQVHGMDLAANSALSFTQAFGSMDLSTEVTHAQDWHAAKDAVAVAAERALPTDSLERAHQTFSAQADLPCGSLLSTGHGWGWLEAERRAMEGQPAFPASIAFPPASAGSEEQVWHGLLTGGSFPELSPDELPRSWMVDPRWQPYLEEAIQRNPQDRAAHIRLGVLLYENGQEEPAARQWELAGEQAAALRSLACFYDRRGDLPRALSYLERAATLQKGPEIAREYLDLLNRAERYEDAWQVYTHLPEETARDERVMILAAAAAFQVGAEDFLERAFAHPYAVIREGETQITDLWFRYMAKKEAERTGRDDLEALERALRGALQPPQNIDYRLTQI